MTMSRNNPHEGNIVYVMVMPMPQLERNHILLGITNDIIVRERQHNSSNTYPVKCIYAREMDGEPGTGKSIEQALLTLLTPYRLKTRTGRLSETLWINVSDGPTEDDVIGLLKLFPGTDIDLSNPDAETAENRSLATGIEEEGAARRPKFRFGRYGIGIGSKLNFKYEDAEENNLECEVVDEDSNVEFQGQTMRVSAATRVAMEHCDRANASGSYQGTLYWYHNGKLLQRIRDDHEAQELESDS